MSAVFPIEHGVPIPRRARNDFPFDEMEVDDSFFVADQTAFSSAKAAAVQYGKLHGQRFLSRVMGGGLRIWRVE